MVVGSSFPEGSKERCRYPSAEAKPRCRVTFVRVKRFKAVALERGRYPTETRQVVANPWIAAGSPGASGWLRVFPCMTEINPYALNGPLLGCESAMSVHDNCNGSFLRPRRR